MALLDLLAVAAAGPTPLPAPNAPTGLTVTLRTVGGKTTFRLSEVVPLEVVLQTAKPSTFSIELADGWHAAPADDRFLVEPRGTVVDRWPWWHRAYTCCDSRRAYLRPAPVVYAHELTDFARITTPGDYQIQYETRRVFAGAPAREFALSPLTLRSNVLTLHIVEDDPQWLDDALASALSRVAAPRPVELSALPRLPRPGSLTPRALTDAAARYRQAASQLRMLDSTAAVRARVAGIALPSIEEWRASELRHGGFGSVRSDARFSSRPDLFAAALQERAAAADFGITGGYFQLWLEVRLERDHPELFCLLCGSGLREPPAAASSFGNIARRSLLETVRELHRTKTGLAAEITATTIRNVERLMTPR